MIASTPAFTQLGQKAFDGCHNNVSKLFKARALYNPGTFAAHLSEIQVSSPEVSCTLENLISHLMGTGVYAKPEVAKAIKYLKTTMLKYYPLDDPRWTVVRDELHKVTVLQCAHCGRCGFTSEIQKNSHEVACLRKAKEEMDSQDGGLEFNRLTSKDVKSMVQQSTICHPVVDSKPKTSIEVPVKKPKDFDVEFAIAQDGGFSLVDGIWYLDGDILEDYLDWEEEVDGSPFPHQKDPSVVKTASPMWTDVLKSTSPKWSDMLEGTENDVTPS